MDSNNGLQSAVYVLVLRKNILRLTSLSVWFIQKNVNSNLNSRSSIERYGNKLNDTVTTQNSPVSHYSLLWYRCRSTVSTRSPNTHVTMVSKGKYGNNRYCPVISIKVQNFPSIAVLTTLVSIPDSPLLGFQVKYLLDIFPYCLSKRP